MPSKDLKSNDRPDASNLVGSEWDTNSIFSQIYRLFPVYNRRPSLESVGGLEGVAHRAGFFTGLFFPHAECRRGLAII